MLLFIARFWFENQETGNVAIKHKNTHEQFNNLAGKIENKN